MSTLNVVPETVGLIMDGNGRWALEQQDSRINGHTKGIVNMISLVAHAFERGVKNVICYGLSTENLMRPKEEIEHIYELMLNVFDLFVSTFTQVKACVKYVGALHKLPTVVRASMKKAEEALRPFESCGRTIYIAVAYGSRTEIVNAINEAVKNNETVTEENFLSKLSVPIEPDLIIRTGGERRLSNFLLYQLSYAELYFSDKLFPDFGEKDLDEAFGWFAGRTRKYGQVSH